VVAIFPLPAWLRLLTALGYAVAVGLAVWLVDASPPEGRTFQPAAALASNAVELRAEATFPVARWTVLVDGHVCSGRPGERSWNGIVHGHQVLVQAERADGSQEAGAVRVAGGGHEALGWGDEHFGAQRAASYGRYLERR